MHCHSIFSDGTHTPKELIDLAKKQNLQGLSITDHDTVAAYTDELFIYAEGEGVTLVSGVEFSTYLGDIGVHILGYDFDWKNPTLLNFCNAHTERRKARNQSMLEKLEEEGMPINIEELEGLGRPHIAKAMIQKGYVEDFKEAFDFYIGDGRPCYVKGESFSVEETIEIIRGASGKVFLAHPIFIEKRTVLNQLLQMDFDGIECYYGKCNAKQNQDMIRLAEKHGMMISGGSDFHGENKAYLPLGAAFITEEHFFKIWTATKS